MRVERIELRGFKRMRLNDYKGICIDFNAPIQQILGTNGSGKSSLLHEINPLPGETKDFEKGGKKHIWINHRGSRYECISDFSDGAKHTFIKDGEVLNDAGNGKIQSDLAYKYFGYNKNIRDFLLSKKRFTQMGPTERRNWMTLFSVVDYSYGIKVYKYFSERFRDITGTLKEYHRRLVHETNKSLKAEEIKKLESETNQIHKDITTLLEQRNNPGITVEDLRSMIAKNNQQIQDQALFILNKQISIPYKVNSIDDLLDLVQQNEIDKGRVKGLIDKLQGEYKKLENELKVLKETGFEGIKQFDTKIQDITNQINGLMDHIPSWAKGITHAQSGLNSLENIEDSLLTLLSELPENKDRRFSQKALVEKREQLTTLNDKRQSINASLGRLQARRSHFEEHRDKGSVSCPRCHHNWIMGFDEAIYKSVVSDIEDHVKTLESLDNEIKELNNQINEFLDYGTKIREYRTITQSIVDLKPFWDYIDQEQLLTDSPNSITTLIHQCKVALVNLTKASNLSTELDKAKSLLLMAQSMENHNVTDMTKRLGDYSEHLSQYNIDALRLEQESRLLFSIRSQIEDQLATSEALDKLIKRKNELDQTIVSVVKFEVINSVLKEKQSLLALKEDILSEVNNQRNRVEDLEEQITILEKDKQALKLLVENISPTEGLIADGMLGFIESFTTRVNRVIDRVWTYPLEVKSCSVDVGEEIDLDYKFPVSILSEANLISDISEGSDAMKEIIDIAFMLVGMQCLGMQDYPVMLDEFASSFDESHRSGAVELVKNLLDHYTYSQLFMVSHYFTLHGAISNAEICVLNKDNLSVATTHNEHVSFIF